MKTNLEKWNFYEEYIKGILLEQIELNVEKLPEKVYKASGLGAVVEVFVDDIYNKDRFYFYSKKPTRADVEKIKTYADNIPEFNIDNIFVSVHYHEGMGKSMSACKHSELKEKYFLTEVEAKERLVDIKAKKDEENELIANGHIRCAYCGKITPPSESIRSEIIFQNGRHNSFTGKYQKFVDRKTNDYCSGKCASHDQMAHEG